MTPDELRAKIREIPDFPKPGILFYDITTLLKDPPAYRAAIDAMLAPYLGQKIDVVVGMESRGFIFSAPMAYQLGAGPRARCASSASCRPRRSASSTPSSTGRTPSRSTATRSQPGQQVLIVDDLLATGGTVRGTVDLVRRLQGEIVGLAFLVELAFLKGRDRLVEQTVTSVIQY